MWWITYNVNKLTHKSYLLMYLVTIIKKKVKFVNFAFLPVYAPQVVPRCPDFWNKWSWGLCLILMLWITYSVNKLTHKTYLEMYLVTIIKKKVKFVNFAFLLVNAPRCPDFWNKWSRGLCLIPMLWIAYSVNKLTHKIYLAMYLVTIIKKKVKFVNFAFLPVYAPKLHPDAPTFKINGHEASVWYQYDELDIVWTNWPIKPIW